MTTQETWQPQQIDQEVVNPASRPEMRHTVIGVALVTISGGAAGLVAGVYGYGNYYYNSQEVQPANLNVECAQFIYDANQSDPNARQAIPDSCSTDYLASQQADANQVLVNNVPGSALRPPEQMLNDAHTALQEVQQNQLDAVLLAGKMGGIIGLLAFGAAGVTYAYKKRHPRVNVPMSQGPKNPIDKLAETKQEKIRRVENATTPR